MEKENQREAGSKHGRTDMKGGREAGRGRKKRGLQDVKELDKCCALGGVALSHKAPDLHEN